MTRREARFCDEYLIDLDAASAAVRAGYSPEAADGAAGWLEPGGPGFKRAVYAGVRARLAACARRTGVTAERVIREYARIAFANLGELVDPGDGTLRPGVSADDLAAVASYRYKQDQKGTVDCDVKLCDKMKALEVLSRCVGLGQPEAGAAAEALPRIVLRADGSAELENAGGGEAV